MCGRFTVAVSQADLFDEFGLTDAPFDIRPRYNVAPMQLSPVLLMGEGDSPRLALLRWGLVPFWAKEPGIGNKMINARADTLAEKPAFRSAFERRRCLVLADGWYEWRKEGARKTPMWIHLRTRRPFAMAGIWERWDKGDEPLLTFSIVTTDAAAPIRHIHDRMPVLLPRGARERWLDPAAPKDELRALLGPYAGDDLESWAVSTLVNSPRNDVEDCIFPVDATGVDEGASGGAGDRAGTPPLPHSNPIQGSLL